MGRLLPFLILADIALVVVALFDCLTSDEEFVRGLPRIGWVLLIVLLSPIGPIMWFVSRRAEENANALGAAPVPDAPAPERAMPVNQLPPDDDPEFLRDLAVRAKDAAQANRAENERRRAESKARSDEARAKDDARAADDASCRRGTASKWEADLRAREEKLREGQPHRSTGRGLGLDSWTADRARRLRSGSTVRMSAVGTAPVACRERNVRSGLRSS